MIWNRTAGRSEGTFIFPVRVAAVRISDDQPVGEADAFVVDTTLGSVSSTRVVNRLGG
jgi:hypothetical protein